MATKTMTLSCLALAVILFRLSNLGSADAAKSLYAFGDSYLDTGNIPLTIAPYGSDWPGHPDGRWSDGRIMTDYFAELFGLPTPTLYEHLKKDSVPLQGINFAYSGAGITYAWGSVALDTQVDRMEALVDNGVITEAHLKRSVAVMNIGVNDYDARNFQSPFQEFFGVREQEIFVHTVVNGIAMNIMRLHSIGIRNIVVLNLPLMACLPLSTLDVGLAFRHCSTNTMFVDETSLHNSLLQQRVRMLNQQLKGLHVVIADQTKAMDQLFYHGSEYGFENALTPCCHGKASNTLYSLNCGSKDSKGQPVYTVCEDPSKAVLYDAIHLTQAASKALVNFFASVPGYTSEGPKLHTWIKKYNV